MDHSSFKRGLSSSTHRQSSFDNISTGDSLHQHTPCCSQGRGRQAVGQRSGSGSSTKPDNARVLLRYLSGSQERYRRTSNDPQLGDFQQVVPGASSTIHDVDYQRSFNRGTSGRLGCVTRLEGCLSSRPHTSEVSQVSPVHLPRETFRMDGSSVRNLSSSMVVHEDNFAHLPISPSEGYLFLPLHRRLSDEGLRSLTVVVSYPDHPEATSCFRLDDQHREVSSATDSAAAIYRRSVTSGSRQIASSMGQMGEDSNSCHVHFDCSGDVPSVAETVGSSYLRAGLDASGSTADSQASDVLEPLFCVRPTTSFDSAARPSSGESSLVDDPVECLRRNLFAAVHCDSSHVCRRISRGLGCPFRQSDGFGSLVTGSTSSAYQHIRTVGSRPSDSSLETLSTEHILDDCYRQCDGSRVYQQDGWHSLPTVVRRDLPTIRVSGQHSTSYQSETYSGNNQHSGRRVISPIITSVDRMDASSRGFSLGLPQTLDTESRLVCDTFQSPTSGVCVADSRSRSPGSGRSRHQLGGLRRLRVSTTDSDSQGASAIPSVSLSSPTHCPDVAEQTVVSRSSGIIRSRSVTTTNVDTSSSTSLLQAVSSGSRTIPSSRLDFITSTLKKKGFSSMSTAAILRAHRPSTTASYNVRWLCFQRWCRRLKIRPQSISIPQLAEFLLYLRNSLHLKGSTIAGYLTVIATVRDPATNKKIATFPELQAIIKSFKHDDQIQRFRPPKWNLTLVLQSLTSAPYEPLQSASLEDLTRKTVFLLGFATAARVSEIHALDVDLVRFRRQDSAVHLGLMMNFVAKNQLPGQASRSFTVQALSSILGADDIEDLSLCPVRALKIYVQRTQSFRARRKRLFLSCNKKHLKDISRNTVSMWIRSTILQAYKDAGLSPPQASNPHELRALAATMSLHCNTPVSDILTGCFWATDSVFATFYLRDVSTEDVEGFHHLGPVVAAQTLVNTTRHRHRRP